jgi:hypothetical protein
MLLYASERAQSTLHTQKHTRGAAMPSAPLAIP